MLNFINTLFNPNKVEIGKLQKIVDQINLLEEKVKKLKDDAFPAEIAQYKEELKRGKTLDDILPEVFALTREAAVRVLGQRPYDVQLMAAIAFHQGNIAEQKTGEGKTLSAVPAMVLNALT